MSPDEILVYNTFDVIVAQSTPPRKTSSVIQKISCWFGLHFWGFTHCLCCGKRDEPLCEIVICQWEGLPLESRVRKTRIARESALASGLDFSTLICKQLRWP